MNKIKMNKIKENEDFIFEMIFFEEIYEEEKNKIIKLAEITLKVKMVKIFTIYYGILIHGMYVFHLLMGFQTIKRDFADNIIFQN